MLDKQEARLGQQLGHYRMLRVLGQGTFATVYLGEHQYLERLAAIKILHMQMEAEAYESFRREARTIAQLDHPHIIGVHDFGIHDQTPYLVMEYTQGGTLRSRYPKGTRLSCEQIMVYVKQIAAALDYAHGRHVIHRDVKPENILLNTDHEIVLSDFGIAVVQRTLGSLSMQDPAGTPVYMAPEQIQRKPCAASDQYALGVMVYEWLRGEPPFNGSLLEMLNQHLYESPPSLCTYLSQLPPAVEAVVFRALAKDPGQRFSSVTNFATALSEAFSAQSLSLGGSFSHGAQDHTFLPVTPSIPVSGLSPRKQNHPDGATQLAQHTERREELVSGVSPQVAMYDRPSSKQARFAQTNRQRLLQRVRSFWITGVLEQSLHGSALMALRLEVQPDAVVNPWHLVLQHPDTVPYALPTGTSITQVYDDTNGELLILGAPGAGKTTLLLELARSLLDRAEQDEHYPVPVVFNLSSWAVKRQPLIDWLVEELVSKYQVPRKLGHALVNADQILPLLDGLDEVAPKERTACIETINLYRQAHGLLPLVVCSRSADYLAQTTHVLLRSAVAVQPLTQQQIEGYLEGVGEQAQALREALGQDKDLYELATTPLMLTILLLVYKGTPPDKIKELTSLEAKQEEIFAIYVQHMLKRRGASQLYKPEQVTHWLSYLAARMKRQNQTEFHIERIQPDWLLGKSALRFSYAQLTRLATGLFSGLIGGLAMLVTWLLLWQPITVLITGLTREMAAGQNSASLSPLPGNMWMLELPILLLTWLMLGLTTGLLHHLSSEIKPAEVLHWSWRNMRHGVKTDAFLKGGLLTWLLFGLFFGLSAWLFYELAVFIFWPVETSLFDRLFSGLVIGLLSALLALVYGNALWPIAGAISEYVARSPHSLLAQHIELKPKQKGQGPGRKQKGLLVGLASGLVCGPLCGLLTAGHLVFFLALIANVLPQGVIPQDIWPVIELGTVGLVMVITLLTGLANGLFIARTHYVETTLNPLRVLVRLWRGMVQGLLTNEVLRRGILTSLVLYLAIGLFLLFFWQSFGQALASSVTSLPLNKILFWLIGSLLIEALDLGLFFAWIFGLVRGITRGLSSNMLDTRAITRPNQGMRRSVRNSIAVSLVSWLVPILVFTILGVSLFGLSLGLLGTLVPHQPNGLLFGMLVGASLGLSYGQYIGLVAGLENGLFYGGSAFVQHCILRFLLWSAGHVPRNYVRFLDYASERILLRKVGGGYIFVHRLLLDYFANLEVKPSADVLAERKQEGFSSRGIPPVSTEPIKEREFLDIPVIELAPTSAEGSHLLPCGHALRPNARFCPVCGRSLVS